MIMLTGATGFVGKAVLESLIGEGLQVSTAGRSAVAGVPFIKVDFADPDDIRSELAQVDTIIHCAGRAHVMNETATDPLAAFRQVNTAGTLSLARQAVEAGVKHFIFISSIKVNGEETEPGAPFSAADKPNPQDAYGVSKAEAEQALFELAESSELEITVIRPTLVYGPGVGANFAKLFESVKKGIPLPLGGVNNKRSMVAVDNLVSLIKATIHNSNAYGETFLVSDGHDVSTRELIEEMQKVLQKKSNLIPLPPVFLYALGAATGKTAQVKRLCGSLQVNIEPTKQTLGWTPPVTMHEELLKMVEHDRRAERAQTRC